MFDLHSRTLMVKIVLGIVLGLVSVGMLLYLIPMPNGQFAGGSGQTLANVDGQQISVSDVQRQLDLISQRQPIPQQLRGFYAKQIFNQMVFNRLLAVEASRLGLTVSNQELARQIQAILPQAFPNGKWVGAQAYSSMVQQGFGLSVSDFEDQLRQGILQQKFRQLVTASVTVSPEQVRKEFLRRNQKAAIDYILFKPSELTAKIKPTRQELQTWYNDHKREYQVPEKRSASYLLLDMNQLKKNTTIPEAQLQAYYQKHIGLYKVPARAHVEHILFMTVGKPTAEIAEIKKKAEKVLAELQHGGNFAKLAKEYSEDPGSKDKGGDLGWIVRGQTVPAFQHVAFNEPVGQISKLVKTEYGFDIIKVLARQDAHTKSFAEVRDQILQNMLADRVSQEADNISNEMANIVRNSSRQSLAAVEKALGPKVQPDLVKGQTPVVSVTEPMGPLGNSQDVRNALFGQSIGQLSLPIRTDNGYLILTVDKIVPAHQGTFAEVQDRVRNDYLTAKSAELARTDANEAAAQLKKGTKLAEVAKTLGVKVSSAKFSRTGNVANAPAKNFLAAFTAPAGQVEGPEQVGTNWVVYTVTGRDNPTEAEFDRQRSTIRQELLNNAQDNAFDAFRQALENQMKRQGKLSISSENLKLLTSPSES